MKREEQDRDCPRTTDRFGMKGDFCAKCKQKAKSASARFPQAVLLRKPKMH